MTSGECVSWTSNFPVEIYQNYEPMFVNLAHMPWKQPVFFYFSTVCVCFFFFLFFFFLHKLIWSPFLSRETTKHFISVGILCRRRKLYIFAESCSHPDILGINIYLLYKWYKTLSWYIEFNITVLNKQQKKYLLHCYRYIYSPFQGKLVQIIKHICLCCSNEPDIL